MHEIVFLIDTSLATCSEREHCSEVILTMYRLLSSFRKAHEVFKLNKSLNNKRTDKTHSSSSDVYMKWGCKFFNTSRTIPRNRSCTFSLKKFKLAHLEDFERKLVEVFSAEKEDTTKLKSRPKAKRFLHPAELLSTALTETLHDFKWTAYDALTSPVSYRRSNPKSSVTFRRNIFIFTKIPCSKKSLRFFANKMVLDSDVLIDSFMSPALLHEYQQKMKISLNCVDFSSDGCSAKNYFVQDIPTSEGLSILKDAFRKLGGCFISKDVILCCVPTTNDCTQSSDSSLDHIQIISNFPSESLLSTFQEMKQMSSEVEILAKLSCKSFQCLPINLTPVARTQDKGMKQNFTNAAFQSCKPPLLTEADGKSREEECIHQPMDLTDIHFTLLGYVPHAVLCDLVVNYLSNSFMLSCGEGSLVSSLLQQLAFSRNFGLLCMTTRGQPSLMLALLQAQNRDFGFISLLSLEATLKVEKALLQHHEARFIEEEKIGTEIIQRHFDIPSRLGLMERLHKDIQQLKSSVKTAPPALKNVEESHIFQSHCLNSWHVPGSTSQMSSLINKITLATVDSKSEKDFMKQLQQHYMKERHPPEAVQNLQPPTSTPICGFRYLNVGSSGDSESGSRSSHDGLRSSTLSRGRLMVNRARSANFTTTEDENDSFQSRPGSPERRRSSSVGLFDIGLTTEEDLKNYLHRQYDQALNAGVAIETTIQTVVRVTSQFISKTQTNSHNKSAVNFINEHITLSSSKLKEKYNKEGTEENKSNRVNEYKLQAILILEMESVLNEADTDHSQVLNELVSMLRALSFLAGTTHLTSFLADIVSSYLATLPQLLVDIFDELMLPLPPALAKFASPATPSSLFGSQLSLINENSLLSAPGSSQPSSHLSDQSSQHAKRYQKFKQHPSISDFRQKKQILVKPKLKVEIKKQVKDKVRTRSSSSRAGHGGDCERAKRNLFSDKTKPGSSKTKDKSRGSHKQRPSRSKTSRTLVLGTPVHKQTSQRHLWQQERHRRRENIQPEVQVVAESPMKDDVDDDINNGGGDNSTFNWPARYIVREAFYSSNTQPSRSLARSLELAQKEDGQGNCSQNYMIHSSKSQGTLASAVRGESPILSPKSRLLKTFLSSPSPTPKPKWKHKPSVITPKSKQKHHKSPVTTPLRRSPRKSAKKLVFKDIDKKNSSSSSKPADNAHLIFAGENANDFDLLVSPTKDSSKYHFHGGYKTPEKQVTRSHPFNSEAASCPPVLLYTSSTNPALNLSFRNILSSDKKVGKISKVAALNLCTGSSEDISTQSPNNSPSKQVLGLSVLSSQDTAPRLRVSALPKYPVVNNSFLSFSQGETSGYLSSKQVGKDGHSSIDLICTQTRGNKTSDSDQGKYVFTTPKKVAPSHIHTTPSKVKFLESCLISPPTGSGYPPSLEKSTPGKSILKNSPVFKGKVKRRIELQSVSSSLSMKHTTFMGTNIEPNSWIPTNPEEKAYSSSETELNSSIYLLGKQHEAGQICQPKPDSKSFSDKGCQNVKNKILLNPYCRITPIKTYSCERTPTNLHDIDSAVQNSKSNRMRDKMESSSSEDTSYKSCPKKSDLPAAVTICTVSSGNKPRADTINKWVRLKKSSPKNGTNSSSKLALSSANLSSGNDGKLRSSCTRAYFSCLETGDGKNVNEGLSVKKQSKKRSLLFEDDSPIVLSPSKRRKSESRLGSR